MIIMETAGSSTASTREMDAEILMHKDYYIDSCYLSCPRTWKATDRRSIEQACSCFPICTDFSGMPSKVQITVCLNKVSPGTPPQQCLPQAPMLTPQDGRVSLCIRPCLVCSSCPLYRDLMRRNSFPFRILCD